MADSFRASRAAAQNALSSLEASMSHLTSRDDSGNEEETEQFETDGRAVNLLSGYPCGDG